MARFNKVAVLMGGRSAEREVSLKTGQAVARALKTLGHEVVEIDAGSEVCSRLVAAAPDAAFIALHGRYGEDGTIQGLLELLSIPYAGSGVLASSLAMDKVMSKKIFRIEGIPVCEDCVVSFDQAKEDRALIAKRVVEEVGLPVIVKPSREGSTIGVTVVEDAQDLSRALDVALAFDCQVLVEKFIPGRLFTVALVGREAEALPVVEVKARSGFYDYEAKYTAGMTEYVCPAELAPDVTRRMQEAARHAHLSLGCDDVSRVDLILDDAGRLYVLEVNTIPGMTETSLVPKAAKAAGIEFPALIDRILDGAALKLEPKR